MTHRDAPGDAHSPRKGAARLVERCRTRPVAHVGAETGGAE
ncbi:hypothetical protein ACFWWT_15335 [Streptomyces sp. NPDC058676]